MAEQKRKSVAVGLFLTSDEQASKHIDFACEIAVRMDQQLVLLCVVPLIEKDAAIEPPPAEEVVFDVGMQFHSSKVLLETSHRSLETKGVAGSASRGMVDVLEVPARIGELRTWLGRPQFSTELGRFKVRTLLVPVDIDTDPTTVVKDKSELFNQCRSQVALFRQLPGVEAVALDKVGIITGTRAETQVAVGFLTQIRSPEIEYHDETGDHSNPIECAVAGVLTANSQIDRHSGWSSMIKSDNISTAIAIKPAATPVARLVHFVDEWMANTFSDYRMTRENRNELADSLYATTSPSVDYLVFMTIATMLASIGLIQDSAAVIIGAMLVAPLLTPLMAVGLSLIHGNRPEFTKGLVTIAIGVVLAFLVGTTVGMVAVSLPDSFNVSFGLGREMIARTSPNALDPVIGLAAGMAGGFVVGADRSISTLAGTAIAVALVPPIATAGLEAALILINFQHAASWADCFMLNSYPQASAAGILVVSPLTLFLINAITVIFGAYLGLRAVGMHRTKYAKGTKPWGVKALVAMGILHFLLMSCLFWFYAQS